MLNTKFDWVAQRHRCRGPETFALLWRGAADNVETANRLLAVNGTDRPFSVWPYPPPGTSGTPPPRDSFAVRRKRPDG